MQFLLLVIQTIHPTRDNRKKEGIIPISKKISVKEQKRIERERRNQFNNIERKRSHFDIEFNFIMIEFG